MTQKKKKPAVKKPATATVDVLHNETKLNAQEIVRINKDIAGLRYLIGDLATRIAVLESRPVQSASQTAPWWKTIFLGADADAG